MSSITFFGSGSSDSAPLAYTAHAITTPAASNLRSPLSRSRRQTAKATMRTATTAAAICPKDTLAMYASPPPVTQTGRNSVAIAPSSRRAAR